MNILDMIKLDHEQVKDLLGKMEQTTPRAGKRRQEMYQQLKTMMTAHNKAEERLFYPDILANKQAHELALEAIEEHNVATMSLKDLGRAPVEDEHWKAKVCVFHEIVGHHIQEEEGEIFPSARKILSEDRLQSMGREFQKEQAKYKQMRQMARAA